MNLGPQRHIHSKTAIFHFLARSIFVDDTDTRFAQLNFLLYNKEELRKLQQVGFRDTSLRRCSNRNKNQFINLKKSPPLLCFFASCRK